MPAAYAWGVSPPARVITSATRSLFDVSAYVPGYFTCPVTSTVRCSSKFGWRSISTLSNGLSGTSGVDPAAGNAMPGAPT